MARGNKWYFHFNAIHSIEPGDDSKKHPHTFYVNVFALIAGTDLNYLNDCQKAICNYIESFSGQYLNENDAFKDKIPTVENICEVFYYKSNEIAKTYGFKIAKVEVGDTPTMAYSIGESLLIGADNRFVSEASYRDFVNKQCS